MTAKVPTPILHISNLKQKKNGQKQIEEALKHQCSLHGNIVAIQFIQQSAYKNMCLVEFENVSQSINAMIHLHNFPIFGRKIQISFTRSKIL